MGASRTKSFHEQHPKIAGGAFTHSLRTASLRRLIQNHLKLDHKYHHNLVLQFFDFVKSRLVVRPDNPEGLVRTIDSSAAPPASKPKNNRGSSRNWLPPLPHLNSQLRKCSPGKWWLTHPSRPRFVGVAVVRIVYATAASPPSRIKRELRTSA